MEPIDELKYIHDKIEYYSPTDSAYELAKMVRRAIELVEKLPTDSSNQYFEGRRAGVIKELKHTLNKEVKLFALARKSGQKKEHLESSKRYLTRDIILYLSGFK